jgi:hypothetical protein
MRSLKHTLARFTASLVFILVSFLSFAQEKTDVNIDINKDGGSSNWYTQPWVWIIGAAVFILLLIALLRGNRSRD